MEILSETQVLITLVITTNLAFKKTTNPLSVLEQSNFISPNHFAIFPANTRSARYDPMNHGIVYHEPIFDYHRYAGVVIEIYSSHAAIPLSYTKHDPNQFVTYLYM